MQVSEQPAPPASRARRLRAALAGPAVLLVILTGFYWKLTLTRQYTWLESPDMANQVLPWLQFQAGEWHRHHFPLWDPYEWGGQSLIGQAQPGVAYPFNWLLFLVPLRHGWLRQTAVHWYFVLIHYMGALFCYWLCRDLKRSRGASLLAGAAFGATGWMGTNQWPQMLNGGVWAPLVFLFLLRTVRGERPVANAALSGAALGMAFLSGHHQIPIFITLAAAGVWLYLFLARREGRKLTLLAAAVFGLFLFLVGAFQTLPAYEYGKLAVRWVGAKEPVGWNEVVPYSVHNTYSLYPTTLLGTILPGILRTSSPYIGMTLLALAFLAVAGEYRDRMVRILGAVALGGLAFSLGAYDVFHGIIYAVVPVVEKARSASMAILIFHFGIIVLSAFAVDAYLRLPEHWTRRVVLGVLGISATVWLLLLAFLMLQIPKGLDYDRIAAAAFFGLLLAALLHAWRRGALSPRAAATCALLLILMEGSLESTFYWANRDEGSRYLKKMSENTDLVDFIRKQQRFVRLEIDDQEIPYNFGDWHGIDVFGGYLASLTANTTRVLGDYRARMIFGVDYYIGKKPLRENQVQVFAGADDFKIYSNPEAFPEAWSVHDAVSVKRDDVLISFQKYSLEDLRKLTFMVGDAPRLEKCETADWVRVLGRDTSSVSLEADMSCTGLVILGDAYYPGWVAAVDGKPARIYEAYGAVRGVVVGAGVHRIEMRYRPKSVYWGAALTALGLLGACVIWFTAPSRRGV